MQLVAVLGLLLAVGQTISQEQGGPPFLCPESNGFFPDPEQCDKYYECVGEIPEEKFCPDGLLFEASNPNNELCDYPFNVDCGAREYVQEPEPGLDPRCYRANGFFNHEDPEVCNKYYNCVHGYPHIYDCPPPLIFDEAQGTCVREEQASTFAKKCVKDLEQKDEISGFSCPVGDTLGPNGQPLAHPSFRHPTSCKKYLVCYFSKDLNELGCMDGQVYNYEISKCVAESEGTDDCKCWYSCPDSCPDDCFSNCECPEGN